MPEREPERSGIMKEYRLIKTTQGDAEETMNTMAAQGWKVVGVTYWSYWWVHLLITFEREL